MQAAKAQSWWTARSSRAASGIRSLRRGLKDLDFKGQTNRNLAKECDCMRKKFFVVIAIIVVLVILLTPVRMNLKDGGSVRYKALVYEVTKIHQLSPEVDGVKPYIDGFEIKILGMTVYRETNE